MFVSLEATIEFVSSVLGNAADLNGLSMDSSSSDRATWGIKEDDTTMF